MKVAAGETNKTLITIILIAVVDGVGIILVPIMMKQFTNRNCCE